VRADGTLAWVLERGQQIRDSNGRIWLDGVIFDITTAGRPRRGCGLRCASLRSSRTVSGSPATARRRHRSLVGLGAILRALSAAADDPGKVRDALATSVEEINSMIDDIRDYMRQLHWSFR